MKTKVSIRYISGREEKFEVDLYGGKWVESRLREFANNPTILLQTGEEIIIIPATAIESITIPMAEPEGKSIDLPNVRKAKRLK
jgi:hypothetical protein